MQAPRSPRRKRSERSGLLAAFSCRGGVARARRRQGRAKARRLFRSDRSTRGWTCVCVEAEYNTLLTALLLHRCCWRHRHPSPSPSPSPAVPQPCPSGPRPTDRWTWVDSQAMHRELSPWTHPSPTRSVRLRGHWHSGVSAGKRMAPSAPAPRPRPMLPSPSTSPVASA